MFRWIAYKILSLFYKELSKDSNYPLKTLFKYAFKQRIGGNNRNVPWPVHFTSTIKSAENIKRGTKYPGYAPGVYIDGRNGIELDENVWIGPKVSIISQNHDNTNFDSYKDGKAIKIGKNSILYTGCIILPEVELQEHTIVAAGAVVTRSFNESNILIGGNPAQILKKLEAYKSI